MAAVTICSDFESESEVTQSCPTLCDPMDCGPPGSSPMGFSKQEYWSGLPFPSPGDLPDPGIGPGSPTLEAVILEPKKLKSDTVSTVSPSISHVASDNKYCRLGGS